MLKQHPLVFLGYTKKIIMEKPSPASALAIIAHPDDAEYFCGGTLIKWLRLGCRVAYVILSSGEKHCHDLAVDINALIATREREQRASAEVIGVEEVTFLRYPDGDLAFADQAVLRAELVRQIRRYKPAAVLTHDPMARLIRQHVDHRVVGQLVVDASFPLSGFPQYYKDQIVGEGLEPWQPQFLFLFGTDAPNHFEDIGEELPAKIDALEKHESQRDFFSGGMANRLRWKARTAGEKYGLAAAEEFLVNQIGESKPVS